MLTKDSSQFSRLFFLCCIAYNLVSTNRTEASVETLFFFLIKINDSSDNIFCAHRKRI